MNKIYKVKKNAAGHSVACSEFAKGHTKKAVLGSLLIAGALGISNTASAQSVHDSDYTVHYSDYSGSYDLDCYRTGRNVHNSRYPDPRKLFWDRRPTNNETKAECVVISGGKNNTIGKAIASTIGGGYGNEIKHPDDDNINAVTISGGKFNKAMQTDATVSGGSKNQAMSGGSTVGGGHKNIAKGETATVGGGRDNQATGKSSTVSGGYDNLAEGESSAIGGGEFNSAIGIHSTVAGGFLNGAVGDNATVSGGHQNEAFGNRSTVAGGELNLASGDNATVSGGEINQATGIGSVIGGGSKNQTTALYSTIAGGSENQATNTSATISGGFNNQAAGNSSAIGGGTDNKTTDKASGSVIGGGSKNQTTALYSTIAGGSENQATNTSATISGGFKNQATGNSSAIGGGSNNKAEGNQSTVGGGSGNQATGEKSTISGGDANKATDTYSTVGGGRVNHATGRNSTVAGGYDNQATGNGSFAAGVENRANTDNAVAVGKKNIIDGDNSAAIGSNNTVAQDKKDVFILGSNTSGVQSNSVLLGNKTAGKQATAVSDATVGDLNLTGFAGTSKAENGVVSVGSEGGERQIVNVGAGQISATSTDAVNGSQLHALATAVNENLKAETLVNRADVQELKRKQENDIKDVIGMQNAIAEQADKNKNDIQDLAKAQLAGATVMEELNKNVEENKRDLSAVTGKAFKNQIDIQRNNDSIEDLYEANAENVERLTQVDNNVLVNRLNIQELKRKQENDIKEVVGMQNAIAEQADKNTAGIAANKADADAKFKGVQTDIANNKIILAQHTKKIDDNQQAIEAKLGDKADLQKLAELKTSVDKNQAGIATNKQELIIQNDRLNQLDETNNRQDQKIDQLGYALKEQGQHFNNRISAVERQTAGGIANAIAIATLPSPSRAGEHHVLFGSGYHNGQAAVSLGAAGLSDTGKSTYKIGLSWSDAGGLSGGVGGSYRWK